MLFRFILFYVAIALLVFITNLIRFIRCARLHAIYENNLAVNAPKKNYTIQTAAFNLLRKAKLDLSDFAALNSFADGRYSNDFNNSFDYAESYFLHQATHCLGWIFRAIEYLNVFLPLHKIGNKFIAVVLALLEGFCLYLLGLYLDTTGIGNKILTFLLEFATALFEH